MEAFGMIVLLGLAVVIVSRVVVRYLEMAREFAAGALVVLGLAAAWITDFDLFTAWGLNIRNHALGVVFTGLIVAGAGYFWQPILGFFEGLARKQADEAQTLEKTQNLRRVA
jgi:intracellular septation protein A